MATGHRPGGQRRLRTVQFTPPHSQCSIQFGKGGTTAEPGSAQAMILVVDDIDAARDDLISRGVDVSEVRRRGPRASSRQGARTSRAPRSAIPTATAGCSRRSPTRLPGRSGRTDMDVASLADLLHETSERHGSFEAVAPPHDWWDWYAAYMDARQSGSTPDGGLRGRRALHGGGQARRRVVRVSPYSPLCWKGGHGVEPAAAGRRSRPCRRAPTPPM